MDEYMMKNSKTAEKVLEDQMDDYWAQKKKKSEENATTNDDATGVKE